MPSPENPQLRESALIQNAAGDAAFEERLATKKLLHVWSIPNGRFPFVTLLLVTANVIITAFAHFAPEPTYACFYANGGDIWIHRKWWGLLGSVFIHAGGLHLVLNCYWIWLFGRLLERELGPLRFLGLFLATAAFSSIAELSWSGHPGVGMSGVAYAFFGFLLVNQTHHPDFRRVISGNIRILMIVWLFLCFALTYTQVLNIANFAHLGGLVSGCLLGVAAYPHRWQKPARAACLLLGTAALTVIFWAPWQLAWQLGHAYRALVAEDHATALAAIEKIRAKDPANEWALTQEASLRAGRGEYIRLRDVLRQLVVVQENAANLNRLAWLLATCSAFEVRDGPKAIELAHRACRLDEWKSAAIIDTLAAAYAESGDFAEAERWMLKAIETAGEKSPIFEAHLDSIRNQQPIHEHPAGIR